MRPFWPVAEPAQADYERLRAAAVSSGALPDELAAARFWRRGLAGLIAWPVAEPVFAAVVAGANAQPGRPTVTLASRRWPLLTSCCYAEADDDQVPGHRRRLVALAGSRP